MSRLVTLYVMPTLLCEFVLTMHATGPVCSSASLFVLPYSSVLPALLSIFPFPRAPPQDLVLDKSVATEYIVECEVVVRS